MMKFFQVTVPLLMTGAPTSVVLSGLEPKVQSNPPSIAMEIFLSAEKLSVIRTPWQRS